MKYRYTDLKGNLHVLEGTEEFVNEKIKEYEKEGKTIIKKEIKEEVKDDKCTRRMVWKV